MNEPEAGWDMGREKLRCMIVLDDNVAECLSYRAGQAYFMAFIVEDRTTGQVRLKFRYRYKDPDERNWMHATTDKRGAEAVEHFRSAIEKVLRTASSMLGVPLSEKSIEAYFPPDDGGDFRSTIIWLEMRDLIEVMVKATGDELRSNNANKTNDQSH